MKLENELIKDAGFTPVKYSKNNDAIIMFMAYDAQDNNKFIADMTKAIKAIDVAGDKVTPRRISKASKYPLKEIEMNLFEIVKVMDRLGI